MATSDVPAQARPSYLTREPIIAALALAGIAVHIGLRFGADVTAAQSSIPLYVVLAVGGSLLVVELAVRLARGRFGSDLLAGISSRLPAPTVSRCSKRPTSTSGPVKDSRPSWTASGYESSAAGTSRV